MEERPGRHLSERDLRALSTDDLLDIIQADIRELDQLIQARRPPAREAKQPSRRARKADKEAVADEPEGLRLHAVICCGHHMGDFPAIARVRCPFCGEWHRSGDFPQTG